MKSSINYPPISYLFSRQINLSDFGLEQKFKKSTAKILKEKNKGLKINKLLKFIEYTHYYSKITLKKYSKYFSNHLYFQPTLFTILAIKSTQEALTNKQQPY